MASPSVYHYSRTSDESDDEEVFTYHITLEETTSGSDLNASDAESIESVQANTTVSAKDSSDISTDDNISDYLMSEYEIASSPSGIEADIFSSMSSTPPRDIEFVFSLESEENDATDVSDYDSDHFNLGSLGDNKFYHTCAQCFSRNTNPAFRFCDSCYQSRKLLFPSKPTRKRKRVNVEQPSKKQKTSTENTATDGAHNEETADPGVSIMDSGFESLSPSTEWNLVEPKEEKCLTCQTNTVNGIFLHGKTAHRCCCYQCSKKIWSKSRRCPICRRVIHNVVLLLNC